MPPVASPSPTTLATPLPLTRRQGSAAGRRPQGRGIRGFTTQEKEADIGRRTAALAVFAPDAPQIASALRAMRQAARAGAPGYDPARHAALCRMAALARRAAGPAPVRPNDGRK
ncbi:hypothetical protein GCM10007301_10390 [Azorhizobium oxalatiphilum]|uniref:Uncharacterized protein n=1 Tax=Azorhizobium oxalatiphilum TaxID=980631 RepID=A0A917BR15_9HYPH|nr:hypothetical protein [Azorhizobium oxalatiphilum]GGF52825.1 hypothetical protein GCM10007301_10390 [Azorhizobium oxalatiphilum]